MAEYPAIDISWTTNADTRALLELVSAHLDDFSPLAIEDHETGDGWRIFFRSPDARDRAARTLAERFGEHLIAVGRLEVADEGWARRSQANLTAVRVGRIIVAPPWALESSSIPAEGDDPVVVIQPSMGFGTGHHATTRLCLRLLQELPVNGRRATDVGTGSGVLAIGAWKLGATHVVAIDCDPDALQNAADNLRLNCAEDGVTLVERDLGEPAGDAPAIEPADLVLANLTASTLERYADRLDRLVRPGGYLVVSGFAPDDLAALERAFHRASIQSVTEEGWAAAVFPASPAIR